MIIAGASVSVHRGHMQIKHSRCAKRLEIFCTGTSVLAIAARYATSPMTRLNTSLHHKSHLQPANCVWVELPLQVGRYLQLLASLRRENGGLQ